VVRLLEEIINDENRQEIKEALKDRKKHEKSIAVSSTISNFLKQIEEE